MLFKTNRNRCLPASFRQRHGMYMDFDRVSGTAADHLSPPSTASRLSESDTSDADLDECRRGAGADSSSCSPPGSDYGHRSRPCREEPLHPRRQVGRRPCGHCRLAGSI